MVAARPVEEETVTQSPSGSRSQECVRTKKGTQRTPGRWELTWEGAERPGSPEATLWPRLCPQAPMKERPPRRLLVIAGLAGDTGPQEPTTDARTVLPWQACRRAPGSHAQPWTSELMAADLCADEAPWTPGLLTKPRPGSAGRRPQPHPTGAPGPLRVCGVAPP